MQRRHTGKPIIRLLLCTATVFAVTAALYVLPLRDRPFAPAVVFLFVTFVVSSTWGFRYAVFVSCLASLAFAWLLPPVGHFGLRDPRDVFALAAFLLMGVITSHLADRVRGEAFNARRSEKELRRAIETMPAMAFSIRPDGSTEFVNRRVLEYTGLSAQSISEPGWQSTIHVDDFDRHMNKWRASLASGEPFENEVRHRSAEGEYRWFLVRAVPLRDERGKVLKWYGILTDIEERKRVESLLAGEKRILEMVAKGDSLVEILDSICLLVEALASGSLASVLLLDGDRVRHGGAPSLPRVYTDAIDGAVIGPSAGSCGTAAYRGQQVIVADIATDPLWANYRQLALPHSLRACWSTPVFSSQGKVIGTFAMYYREPRSPNLLEQEIIEQITHLVGVAIERKLTQDELRRSETYLAEAHRLSRTGSWAFNAAGAAYWSEENFRIWGFDPQQGPPDRETLLQRVHPEDRQRLLQSIQKAVCDRKDYAVDFRIVLPDGTVRHIHGLGHPVFDKNAQLVEVVGTVMDVTDRKRAEEERERLRQLEADLAHLNRLSMMGELAVSLAHEIKQPITAAATNAKTSLRWLQRQPPELQEARESALRVVSNVNRAASIIDRVRTFYTKGDQQRELVDVNEVIREMIVLLRNEALRYSIPIQSELAKDLPKVMADRVQLQQVLMNLMLNSIDSTKQARGSKKLTINSKAESGQLLVSVSGMGGGIFTEQADRIFDSLFTTGPPGADMGLSISRSIIEAHGGRLWATRDADRGATFHFTLPTEAEAGAIPARHSGQLTDGVPTI